MKIVAGLGNPGEKYKKTRHNVGFRVVEKLAEATEFKLEKKFEAEMAEIDGALLVKPQTFMNASGKTVSKLMNFYKIPVDDLWIVHDDLDIRLGEYKIQQGKGPKIHYGVNDIEEKLGRNDFWRVRVGVDNRASRSEPRDKGEKYVLAKFSEAETEIIDSAIEKIIRELSGLLK